LIGSFGFAVEAFASADKFLISDHLLLLDQAVPRGSVSSCNPRGFEVEFLDAQRAFNDTMQGYNEARAEYARGLYLIDSVTGKDA
jgi:hypothetical protein